jgi:hypothetical protein
MYSGKIAVPPGGGGIRKIKLLSLVQEMNKYVFSKEYFFTKNKKKTSLT